MATTSRGSATTQMVDGSRLGEAQMGHRPPAVRLRHTGQQVTVRLASRMASAKSWASWSLRLRTWKARRWADLPPMPGREANSSTSFSRGAGRYSIAVILSILTSQLPDAPGDVGGLVHGGAGHQHVGPGGHRHRGGSGADAAVHLQLAVQAPAVDPAPDGPDLVHHVRHEGLAAEARLHSHHQHHGALVQ